MPYTLAGTGIRLAENARVSPAKVIPPMIQESAADISFHHSSRMLLEYTAIH